MLGASSATSGAVGRPSRWDTAAVPSPAYLLIGLLTYVPVRVLFRLRARGKEHVPRDSGFVLAANHTSNLDPWPLGLPFFRRRQQDLEAIRTAADLCRQGEIVVMFPEGTRRKKGLRKKHQARPHTGAARIALEAGVPLVPAAIKGTDRLSRLGPLRVAYGQPVPLDDLAALEPRVAALEATERLMLEIERLE